jgi:hypothetical protein
VKVLSSNPSTSRKKKKSADSIQSLINDIFHRNKKKNLKFVGNHKRLRIAKAILSKKRTNVEASLPLVSIIKSL